MNGAARVYLTVVAAVAAGCSARQAILHGHYGDFARPGAVISISHDLHFPDARSVVYTFWSDAGSSRYGKGKYRIAKDKLMLTFDGTSPRPSQVQASTQETSRDSLRLQFRIRAAFREGTQTIPGINIGVHDAAGTVIAGAVTKEDGTAQLMVARTSGPKRVQVGFIGWQPVEYQLQDTDAVLDVHLQSDPGQVYGAGTRITFGIAAISNNRLVLKSGQDSIVLLKK